MKRQRKYNIYCGNSQTEKQTDVLLLEEENEENKLVLYNDDVNTFDFVIESLITVCRQMHGKDRRYGNTYANAPEAFRERSYQ